MPDVINYRFRLRRGLAADWAAQNELLLEGEFGLELDTRKKKIGDGVTLWNDLPYDGEASGGVSFLAGTSYTVVKADTNQTLICSNAAPFALHVPTNAAEPIDIGTKIAYTQGGLGAVTVTPAGGVTVHAPNGYTTGRAYDGGVLEKIGIDEWQLWSGPALATVATTGDYNDLINTPPSDGRAVSDINEQTGTTYTLALTDAKRAVRCTNASDIVVTIPTHTTAAIPLYVAIPIFQGGAGKVTIVGASGVTIEPATAGTTSAGDFRVLFKRLNNTWVLA